jgi:hypothetical protein
VVPRLPAFRFLFFLFGEAEEGKEENNKNVLRLDRRAV